MARKRKKKKRGTPPLSSLTAAQRREMVDRARGKLGEAEFHLAKMRPLDRSPNLDTEREFRSHFSAFLASARSPLQVLCPGQDEDWAWVNQAVATWPVGEQSLFRALINMRNISIHEGTEGLDMKPEMVAEHEVPPRHRETRGQHVIYTTRMPGQPPPEVGVATYRLPVDGTNRDAIEACAGYLGLVQRLVDLREGMAAW